MLKRISALFFERTIQIEKDINKHKKVLYRTFIATTIYSILFGFYDYFIVSRFGLVRNDIMSEEVHWSIMTIGILILIAILTRFNIQQMVFSLLYTAMLEDLMFWISQWIGTGIYPFPAPNWWDPYFASFRVLGGLGWPLPFWPYIPFYYIPGFIIVILYYISCYLGPKTSRVFAWIVGPLWLAFLGGLFVDEPTALTIFFVVPIISYSYILIILFLRDEQVFRHSRPA